jgi:putative colanic acid biosynthesis UDP-glucose lipid carrier transferase
MNFFSPDLAAARPPARPPITVGRKWPLRYRSIEACSRGADAVTIVLAGILSALLCRFENIPEVGDFGTSLASASVVSAFHILLLNNYGMYSPARLLKLRTQIRAVCLAWTSILLLFGIAVLLSRHSLASQQCGFAVIGLAMLVAQRIVVTYLLRSGFAARKFAVGKILLVSDQQDLQPAAWHIGSGHEIAARLDFSAIRADPLEQARLIAGVVQHACGADIDEIILEAEDSRWPEVRQLAAELGIALPLPVVFLPRGAASEMLKGEIRSFGDDPCIELQGPPLSNLDRITKRCIDLVVASISLSFLMPLLLLAAIAIKLDSRGAVLFSQRRCGFNGRTFSIYKFRTMHVIEDGPSVAQAQAFDRRITRVGQWLRRTSIDELPQLLNVLNGSMSLVGPRPHALAHDVEFDGLVQQYASRRRVKPGITGWAQINGRRGPTPMIAQIQERVEHDLWYIENWSLGLDFRILLRTPIEVVRGRNAV